MGYRLNRLDKPVLMAGAEPMQTEFDIHHRLESCDVVCSCSHFKAIYISGDDGKSAPPLFVDFRFYTRHVIRSSMLIQCVTLNVLMDPTLCSLACSV